MDITLYKEKETRKFFSVVVKLWRKLMNYAKLYENSFLKESLLHHTRLIGSQSSIISLSRERGRENEVSMTVTGFKYEPFKDLLVGACFIVVPFDNLTKPDIIYEKTSATNAIVVWSAQESYMIPLLTKIYNNFNTDTIVSQIPEELWDIVKMYRQKLIDENLGNYDRTKNIYI